MIKYCIVPKTGHDCRQEDGKFPLFTGRFMSENVKTLILTVKQRLRLKKQKKKEYTR